MYELPKIEFPKLKKPENGQSDFSRNQIFWFVILTIFLSATFGFIGGSLSSGYFYSQAQEFLSKINVKQPEKTDQIYVAQTTQEELIISVIKETSPAVVSIVITKDVPKMETYYENPFQGLDPFNPYQFLIPQQRQIGTEKQEVGGGSGFIISEDGMVLTNKHVVIDTDAEYSVLTNDGKNYAAKVLARDPLQDLAIIKIELGEEDSSTVFPVAKLGDSDKIQIGQTAIAIGNALGEFRNTVSIGAVSGLGRTITASGGGLVETLEDVIQTDTAINKGNSGGPLLNLKGEVIGINTAMVQEAQSIAFAIPINKAKKAIEQVKTLNKIVYPFLGVRYVIVNEDIQKANNLSVDYGALISKGSGGEAAISPNSPAAKAGLKEKDIILEFNGEKITTENPLTKIIDKYNPGDKVSLKVLRDGQEKMFEVTLTDRTE